MPSTRSLGLSLEVVDANWGGSRRRVLGHMSFDGIGLHTHTHTEFDTVRDVKESLQLCVQQSGAGATRAQQLYLRNGRPPNMRSCAIAKSKVDRLARERAKEVEKQKEKDSLLKHRQLYLGLSFSSSLFFFSHSAKHINKHDHTCN